MFTKTLFTGKEREQRNSAKGDFIELTPNIFKCSEKQKSDKYKQQISYTFNLLYLISLSGLAALVTQL